MNGSVCMVDVYAPPWPGSVVDRFLERQRALRVILLPPLETFMIDNSVLGLDDAVDQVGDDLVARRAGGDFGAPFR